MDRELIFRTIHKTLSSHRLQHTATDDGDHYPLVDALSPPGETIALGQEEIDLLADTIFADLLTALGLPLR